MEPDENARSGEAQPRGGVSRIPAIPGLPRLQEITESENNARAPTCMPQSGHSQKHKLSGRTLWTSSKPQPFAVPSCNGNSSWRPRALQSYQSDNTVLSVPEPASKQRKTLSERAGEPYAKNIPAPPSTRPINGSVRSAVGAGVRSNPSLSSTTSRYASSSSRQTSNSSASSYRPAASNGHYRPQSAMTFGRQPHQPGFSMMRSASSLETHQEERHADNKQNGTIRSSRSPSPLDDTFVGIRKPRKRQDERVASAYTRKTSASGTSTARSHFDPEHPFRDSSISAALKRLHLGEPIQESRSQDIVSPTTPSYLPKPVAKDLPSTPVQQQNGSRKMKNSLHSSRPHSPTKTPAFLSKTSNLQAADWDANTRWITMNKQMEDFREEMQKITNDQNSTDEQIKLYKTRIAELEAMRSQLVDDKVVLKGEIEEARVKLHSTTVALEDSRRTHSLEADDLRRKNRNDLEDLRDETRRKEDSIKRDAQDELESLRRRHAAEVEDIEKRLKSELEEERGRRISELEELSKQITELQKSADRDASSREREVQNIQSEIGRLNATVEQEKSISNSLRERLGHAAAQAAHLESELEAAKAKSKFLESDSQAQSQAFADLNARMQQAIESATEANEKLRKEETLRRKLHNQVQELKGNIRVFCRVRPTLEAEEDPARIAYPDEQEDCKEILVTGPEKKSAIGNDATSKHSFSYDHVFGPNAGNGNIFEEISQLVQSALDGYNVCIFCYGQTGSGKTYTMSSEDGMIPLAVKQIYDTAHGLEEKGWKYTMQGSFVEVYNENLNDLLGKADDIDKKKLEIRHDNQRCKTTITDVTEIPLDSPSTVTGLLKRASTNRSVAATKANERSSRSHSVFILKLTGENSTTGERSEGTLNLVDLAGSERLAHSGATGERLKETQSINRSLSCLGDVIGALGQGKDGGHIPYRNSKLTYLLQHSLGGNSKTLMFVMISPLMAHLGETLTSLKFATKVHNTHIGTAKKQTKVKE